MSQAVPTTIFSSNYSPNLLSYNTSFEDEFNATVLVGVGSAFTEVGSSYKGKRYLRIINSTPADDIEVSSGGNNWVTTIPSSLSNDGIFQFSVFNPNAEAVTGAVKIFEGGSLIDTFTFDTGEVYNSWQTFFQNLDFYYLGGQFDFKFVIDGKVTSESFLQLYFDGIKFERSNRPLSFPSTYNQINTNETGYQSRYSASEISLLAATDNVLTLNGLLDYNGGLSFLADTSRINVITIGDVLLVDLAFTCITPSGTDRNLDVSFYINDVFYRGVTKNLIKGVGIEDDFSMSLSVICTEEMVTNGIVVKLNPNSAMSINNRTISVTRVHKSK
jgi:hypothetical protein